MQDGTGSQQNTPLENRINKASMPDVGTLVSTQNIAQTSPTIDIKNMSAGDSQQMLSQILQKNVYGKKDSALSGENVKASDIDTSGKYPSQSLGWDNEDLYGQRQSNWDKAANGIVKTLGLASSTFVQGTAGLIYGLGEVVTGHGLNSLYNNDFSQVIEKFNKSMENALPNYYTARERDAKWYSPDNIFTANFFWDKLIKNAGFSLGALAAGGVVGKAIKGLTSLLPLFSDATKAAEFTNGMTDALGATTAENRLSTFNSFINKAGSAYNAGIKGINSPVAQRFLVSSLGAATEGGIEALQGLNEFRDKKIEEYTQQYGYAPTGADLDKINTTSQDLGNARFGMNMALLTATNYIMLPKILGSKYTTARGIANTQAAQYGETSGIRTLADRTLEATLPKSRAGKLAYGAKNIAELLFSPSEAFEEVSQYAIQKGVETYYNKAYRGQGASWADEMTSGYRSAFSDKEGLESLLLGGLSGGLQQSRGNIIERGITGTGGAREKATNAFLSGANSHPLALKSDAWVEEMKKASARGINLMHEGEGYIRQGDVLEAKDNEHDQLHNYLASRIKFGRYDLVKDDVQFLKTNGATEQGLQELKDSGFADANDTVKTFQARVNNFERHAENINTLFNNFHLNYGGLTHTVDGKTERLYSEEVIDKMVYASSKIADYNNRIPEVLNGLIEYDVPAGVAVDNIIEHGSVKKEDVQTALDYINTLKTDGQGHVLTSDIKDKLKSDFRDFIELGMRRKAYQDQFEKIKKDPTKYNEQPKFARDGVLSVPQNEAKGTRYQDVELGKTYPLKESIMRSGNSIILAPKITPINQTLQGEIETQLPNGEKTFIPTDSFRNFSLSAIDNTNQKVNAAFLNAFNKSIKKQKFSDLPVIESPTIESAQEYITDQNNDAFTTDIMAELAPAMEELEKKIKEEQLAAEKLRNDKELQDKLNKLQKGNDTLSSDIIPPDDLSQEDLDKEDEYPRAPLPAFLSKEADYYNFNNPRPYQKRRLGFLNNLARIFGSQKSGRIKAIAITKNNEAFYGLKGLRDFIVNDIQDSPELFENGILKESEEPIIKLYAIEDGGKLFLSDIKGNKLGELSEDVVKQAINDGVFGVFHSKIIGTYQKGSAVGDVNYSGGFNEEDVKAADEQLKAWRTAMFAQTDTTSVYDIEGISRGVVIRDKENKAVSSTQLATEADLTKDNIITVPTIVGQINVNGIGYKFPVGQPMLVNGSNVDFLNNRKFTDKEAEGIFNLLTQFASKFGTDEATRINNYLHSVLYMRNVKNANAVYIQDGSMHFGTQLVVPFTAPSFEANKGAILDYLANYYVKTNSKTAALSNQKFEEPYVENGELLFRSHDSYGQFMLSNEKEREPFLQTKVVKEIDDNPAIVSRYTTLRDGAFEFASPNAPTSEELVASLEQETTPVDISKKADIEKRRQEEITQIDKVRNARNKDELTQAAKKWLDLDPYDKTQVSLDTRAALLTPGGFERGKQLLLEETKGTEQQRVKTINAKYDAELAALPKRDEGKAPTRTKAFGSKDIKKEEKIEKPKKAPLTAEQRAELDRKQAERNKRNEEQQRKGGNRDALGEFKLAEEVYKPIDLAKEMAYIKAKSPFNITILDDLIKTPAGVYAWGSYKDMTVNLYKAAQVGTGYHELFEGVWKVFASLETKQAILKEFQDRKGTFTFFDGVTYSAIPYKEATEAQMKEQLADEFADYVQTGVMPDVKSAKNIIARWIDNILRFIKSIFNGEITTIDNLFKNIDAGKYKTAPYNSIPFQGQEEFSLTNLNYLQKYETIRGITMQVFSEMLNPRNEGSISLTEFEETEGVDNTIKKVYDRVYTRLESIYNDFMPEHPESFPPHLLHAYQSYWENVKESWNEFKDMTNEYLKTFSIIESALDDVDRTRGEDYSNRDYVDDRKYFQNDAKNTASRSIKLLFATIPEQIENTASPIGIQSKRTASTFMQQQIQYAKNFNSLLYQIANVNSYSEKIYRFQQLGKTNPNFKAIFLRLTSDSNTDNKDSRLNDWKLKVRWWNVFSKQMPIPHIQFNQSNGTSRTNTRDLGNATRQTAQVWIDGLKSRAIGSTKGLTKQLDNDDLVMDTKELPTKRQYPQDRIAFLNALGIGFTMDMYNKLNVQQAKKFNSSVISLMQSLGNVRLVSLDDVRSTTNATGSMENIAEAFIQAGNDYESSYFGINNTRKSRAISPNAVSRWVNDINNAVDKESLYLMMPQLRQVKDSVYLNDILFRDGDRTDERLDIGYIEGTEESNGKPIEGENLSIKDRAVQEINQNLNGRYYILVPADGKTQWLLSLKNLFTFQDISTGANNWAQIFEDRMLAYYITERGEYDAMGAIAEKRTGIFKEISNNYKMPEAEFRQAISDFIYEKVSWQRTMLGRTGGIEAIRDSGHFKWNNLDADFLSSNKLTNRLNKKNIDDILMFRTVNWAISNIETHKMFFGSPLEYKDSKRYKLFLSPRESTFNGVQGFDDFMNERYNQVDGISLDNQLVGATKWSDSYRTVTMEDVFVQSDLSKIDKAYGNTTSTDAQGISTIVAMRQRRMRAGNWQSKDDEQFEYVIANDRQLMLKDGVLNGDTYSKELQQHDKNLLKGKNPFFSRKSPSYFFVEKPIVSGYTTIDGGEYFPVTDKFSIVSYSYAAIRDSNFRDHYVKMLKQDVGYMIMASGRKVGARGADNFYNEDGTVSTNEYKNIINIPFSAYGVQTDTSGKKESQTRGTQVTKLAIVNLFDKGVARPEVESLVKHNISLLKELTDVGYHKLLNELGATDEGDGYKIQDKSKLLTLIKKELERREMPNSIREQLQLVGDQLKTPLEALPNYQQIKSILYSHVDKNITSPKVSGGPKVQVSGALMESYGYKRTGKNNVWISAGLKFYTKEDPVMEIMLPFWASKKLKQEGLKWDNVEELYTILQKSPDSKRLLSGVGFRIPTQEINSIEHFRVKGFLPEEMGDTVIVPEEITTKAGSDFDVDKLNTYLQNLYIDSDKNVRIVPYFGIGEEAKKQLKKWLTANILRQYTHEDEDALDKIDYLKEEEDTETQVGKLYRQSIENEYFKNIQDILSLPENFERLITPNTADDLKAIRTMLVELAPYEFREGATKSIIDPEYMLKTRHNGQSVKKLVGIAALAQTRTAVAQLSQITANSEGFSKRDAAFIRGTRKILLPHNQINGQPTISAIKDVEGRYITDKNSQYINGTVDVFNDAFLAQLNFNKKTAGLYLMLEDVGVPNSTKHPIVSLFMNQPIVRRFLQESDLRGINTLNNKKLISDIINLAQFRTSKEITVLPTKLGELTDLLKNQIDKYYNGDVAQISPTDAATQRLILNEFIKTYLYSQQLFRLQQGTDYDTTNINDTYSLKFKALQTRKTEYNVWNDANTYMNSTFIGTQKRALEDVTDVFSDILVVENPTTQKYLMPIIEQIGEKYISADDKKQMARKLEESLFNFTIQTGTGINSSLKHMLVDAETALVNELRAIKNKLKASTDTNVINGNVILNQLIPNIKGKNAKNTKNITIAVKATDVFTKDLYNDSFNELYNNPITHQLARSLVKLSFLQSGISNSPISFKDAIPADLYAATINQITQGLQDEDTLKAFVRTGAFYKNNTNDENIVPNVTDRKYQASTFNGVNKFVDILKSQGRLPASSKTQGVLWMEGWREDPYISYTYNAGDEENPVSQTRLYKRVEDEYGEPVIRTVQLTEDESPSEKAMYIPASKWGDDWRAQEHYMSLIPSVFNHDYVKIEYELDEQELANFLNSGTIPTGTTTGGINPDDNNDIQNQLNTCL